MAAALAAMANFFTITSYEKYVGSNQLTQWH